MLRSAVSTAIVDRLGVTWDERYGELKRYKERFGNCNVPPVGLENSQLATWAQSSAIFCTPTSALGGALRRLSDIGFDFEPYDTSWSIMLREASGASSLPKVTQTLQVGILIAN